MGEKAATDKSSVLAKFQRGERPLDFTAGSWYSHDVSMRSSLLKPRHWLSVLGALVITIIGAVVFVRTEKHTSSSDVRTQSARYVRSEVTDQAPGVAVRGKQAQANPAVQKAGSPDPVAQKTAATSAESAADAAAALAASVSGSGH